MVLNALTSLADCNMQVETAMREKVFVTETHSYVVEHEAHAHHHEHGRSYHAVVEIIENSGFSSKAKETALSIYRHIAEAEAKVHGESMETIHFHEVGRDEAIKNALGIGMALEQIAPDEIYTSPIYDGKGTVVCSHGEIPVPVPAVMALREKCSYMFKQADVNMEMVTPSGLASLMGMGALPDECGRLTALQEAIALSDADASGLSEPMASLQTMALPIKGTSNSRVVAFAEAKGSRATNRPGLQVYVIEEDIH